MKNSNLKPSIVAFATRSVFFVFCLFGSPTYAFKQGTLGTAPNHQAITVQALGNFSSMLPNGYSIQFTGAALSEIMTANQRVDISAHFFDAAFHFDEETFVQGAANLSNWRIKIASLARDGKYSEARQLLGQSLHSVQDFFAHSTWVERKLANPAQVVLPLLGRNNPFIGSNNNLAVLGTASCNNTGINAVFETGITSGWYDLYMSSPVNEDNGWSTNAWKNAYPSLNQWPANKCVHGGDTGSGLNKDLEGRSNFQNAFNFAVQGSTQFTSYVIELLNQPGDQAAICGLLGKENSTECRVAAVANTPWCDQALSFDGNALPSNWSHTVIRSGPGVRNSRLEAYPTDSGSWITSSNMTMSADIKSVVVEFDNFRSVSGSGQHNIVEFKTSGGKYWRLEDMNYNSSTTQRQIRKSFNSQPLFSFNSVITQFDERSPFFNLGLGTFRTRLTLTSGLANWQFTDGTTGAITTQSLNLPSEFQISTLQTASLAAYTTTGGPTWIDNVNIQCLR